MPLSRRAWLAATTALLGACAATPGAAPGHGPGTAPADAPPPPPLVRPPRLRPGDTVGLFAS
ncbi:MAG: hypothetical protein RJA10_1134, partial [Pseudomonadota bacterium]